MLPQCAHSEPDPKLLLFTHDRNQCLIFHAFSKIVKSFMGTNFWQKVSSKILAKRFMVEFCNGKQKRLPSRNYSNPILLSILHFCYFLPIFIRDLYLPMHFAHEAPHY